LTALGRASAAAFLLTCGWVAGAPAQIVATVNGRAISEGELNAVVEGELRQLRRQEYETKRGALETLINRRLVEAEAASRGTTPEKLLAEEVEAKAPAPSDAEIEAFYQVQKERINRPLETVRMQIRQLLRQTRLQAAQDEFYRSLRQKAKVEVLLRPPKVEVSYDPARVRGDAAAPITIVEFSDFQCTFCQRVQPTLLEVLAKYKGKVNLAYRDFPLAQIHPRAHKAAQASRCALEQGRFWEYHDILYANIERLADDDLAGYAAKAGLDGLKFASCLKSDKYAAAVDEDARAAQNAGLTGTPGFVVNGTVLEGAQPVSAFVETIESELAALNAAAAGPDR
jgi:protein-disulfide isomerase